MIQLFQKEYLPQVRETKTDLSGYYVPLDGIITSLIIWSTIVSVDAEFNLYIDGVPVFVNPDLPVITLPSKVVVVTGLSVAVTRGQYITIGVTRVRPSGLRRTAFQVGIDDGTSGVPAGGATGEVLTKLSGTDFDADWAAGGGGSSIGIFSPDLPYGTPSAFDDEFTGASLDAKWITNISNAPPTPHFSVPSIISLEPNTGGSAQAIMQATTDVDQTFRMKVVGHPKSSGNSHYIGLAVRSGSNRWDLFGFDCGNRFFRQYQCFNPNSVFLQNNLLDLSVPIASVGIIPMIYHEIEYKTSDKTLMYRFSLDGISFLEIDSRTTVLGDAITHIGIQSSGTAAVLNNYAHVDWFRKLQGTYTGGSI